ncbi:hypothetical protein [Sphingobium nicotianae]|uniref:Uncharacterized protein n=1 Tax=Sphingobium nicotianae TaxID=2782607 RepID=A0A9X1DB79_9SPHN|nr:hypothetical protein [Sphingobium nicotianae]MBT2186818.1 hypothetical protein [Sphingobium nicotianae]
MMAYLNVSEQADGLFVNPFPPARAIAGQPTELTQREWTVAWLAREDGLNSIREEGPVRRFVRQLFGVERKNPLSDSRLEALRRIAVLSWRYGYNVAPSEIVHFLSAGWSERQYETLLTRIRAESQLLRGRMA